MRSSPHRVAYCMSTNCADVRRTREWPHIGQFFLSKPHRHPRPAIYQGHQTRRDRLPIERLLYTRQETSELMAICPSRIETPNGCRHDLQIVLNEKEPSGKNTDRPASAVREIASCAVALHPARFCVIGTALGYRCGYTATFDRLAIQLHQEGVEKAPFIVKLGPR